MYLSQPVFVKGEAGVYSRGLERDRGGTVKGSLECVWLGLEMNLLMGLRLAWRPGQKKEADGELDGLQPVPAACQEWKGGLSADWGQM